MDTTSDFTAQVGALPIIGKPGAYSVLLVTPRKARRWIIPKAWPMSGRKDHDAAAREAFEKAGAKGRVQQRPVGAYTFDQSSPNGWVVPVRVMVYLLEVEKLQTRWRDQDERKREWMSVGEAAARVSETGLRNIIERLNSPALRVKHRVVTAP